MKTTGRAKGAGPHRTLARGKPKSEEWCGKPAGLHGPLLLGCGQRLALQGSSANEGRFRQFMPQVPSQPDPSALAASRQCILALRWGAMRTLPSRRYSHLRVPGKVRTRSRKKPGFLPALSPRPRASAPARRAGLVREYQSATVCEWARQRQGFARPCAIR